MGFEVTHISILRVTQTQDLPSPGRKAKSGDKSDSICITWQKAQLDKQQLCLGLCSGEMNNIYSLINRILRSERGHKKAQQSRKLGEGSRKSGINTAKVSRREMCAVLVFPVEAELRW